MRGMKKILKDTPFLFIVLTIVSYSASRLNVSILRLTSKGIDHAIQIISIPGMIHSRERIGEEFLLNFRLKDIRMYEVRIPYL